MAKRKPKIEPARVYDAPTPDGRFRVLVDRLWPRGVKSRTSCWMPGCLDAWMKELAPSDKLRRWFNHDPQHWRGFRKRYFKELEDEVDQVAELRKVAEKQSVLLLYGARDENHNNAVVLKKFLETHAGCP